MVQLACIGGFAATGFFNRAGAAPLQQFGLANYLAQTLPDDAAAADQQTFVVPADPSIPKALDFYETVYERPSDGASDLFSDPLVRMDRNFQIHPGCRRILVKRRNRHDLDLQDQAGVDVE